MGTMLSLLALALVDSTSIGTLVIPLTLVVRSRGVQVRSLAVYLGTVVGLYFLVGIALLVGAEAIAHRVDGVLGSRPVQWVQLILGVALLAYGVLADRLPGGTRTRTQTELPSRLSTKAMVVLAVGAVVVELATMLPYLAAIGIISSLDVVLPGELLVLFGYCLVMILPALMLIGVAAILGSRIWDRLERIIRWVEGQVAETMLWVMAIVGIYLIANALKHLGYIT